VTEARKFQAASGVRDILPPESALWNRVEQKARDVCGTYGFREILLPALEDRALFARSVGADTEIVSKEMFAIEDWPLDLDDPRKRIFTAAKLDILEDAMKRGELPNSEENRKGLTEIRRVIGKMDAEQARPLAPGETHTSWLAGFVRLAHEYMVVGHFMHGHLLALRPEATASVVRAYIEHGMQTQPGDVKLYYMGPMFRRERPQKGRYRQFYQIGAEVLTPALKDVPENLSRDAGVDAEVIEMVLVFIERCGLTGHTLYINSIGCKECRPKYVELLRDSLIKVKDKLWSDSQRRIETNPLRVLDSKLESEQAVIETLPRIAEHLCPACREHFAKLKEELKLRSIPYQENWRLVRGLDYYMRTTFEITAPGLGSQNAICGGGRYDGLVELLGGPPTKGIGFALGTDRLILALQEAGKGEAARALDAYIAWMGPSSYPVAVRVARALRDAGFSVELPHEEMKLRKSLNLADRLGARDVVIIGDDELLTGKFTVRPLFERREARTLPTEQKKLSEEELLEYLQSRTA
jgi:histidyl-tRNA synthetase